MNFLKIRNWIKEIQLQTIDFQKFSNGALGFGTLSQKYSKSRSTEATVYTVSGFLTKYI